MTVLQAAVLGFVQGLTEFLPVSSSGHLVIFTKLFGLKPNIPFDIAMHLATLIAVCAYFWADILKIAGAVLTLKVKSEEFKMAMLIIIASVPTAIIGFTLSDKFESLFSSVEYVGMFLLLTGILLLLADKYGKGKAGVNKMTWLNALIIGTAQGCAIAPGLSRSGTTISTSLLSGLDRKLAARFSFLLSIPAILGASIFKAKDIIGAVDASMLVGALCAMISGYFAIWFFLRSIQKKSLKGYAYYCFIAGLTAIILSVLP